ncbi:MAG: hypothetical protein HKN83_10560 [Gammaproteobacteria bacterium]|nr:hypothetical protein [Gammaproteobacteria bacterium]
MIILAPVDYVFWTPSLEKKLNDFENELNKISKPPSKEILVTGKFDDVSKKQFENNGWKVVNNAEIALLK